MQDELKAARAKIAAHEEDNKRRDADNERRDDELRQSQMRIAQLEKLLTFLKNDDPRIAAYMTDSPVFEPENHTCNIWSLNSFLFFWTNLSFEQTYLLLILLYNF